ncbi:DedA family protein [Thermomicrobium sp. 4228-Ro]|uniref:DedA family protein n=1 Tax=Thermomicrobium sp. 4228-Ro TaxID=2993937 RepID=UPI002249A1FC|nr:DedA family protein [Thermomicrobium sp. 4228-Ro]MCX2726572.1 DedA family protein [Thermomicrobium sp. 4228-Ro]
MESWIRDILVTLGYIGLFILLIAETVFPPIPSEVVLPLAGFLVSRGHLNPLVAVGVATLGSYVGALMLYLAGRYGGRAFLLRYGRILRLGPETLENADRWFRRWGSQFVLWGRLVPVARSVVSVPAGTFRMPFWRFSLLTLIGSSVWNTVLIGSGWLLGEHWEQVTVWVERYTSALVTLAVLSALAWLFFVFGRRRRHQRERTGSPRPSSESTERV